MNETSKSFLFEEEGSQVLNQYKPFELDYASMTDSSKTSSRFLLQTSTEFYHSPKIRNNPPDINVQTVPQGLEGIDLKSVYDNEQEGMFHDEHSISKSSTSGSISSEGELYIDESVISSNEEFENVEKAQSGKSDYLESAPSMFQYNLLQRYKIPNQIQLVYHKNMARKFPNAERKTEQQRLQRKKNTEAARQSRAKAKIMETLIENDCHQTSIQNVNARRMTATQRIYTNSLLKLLGKEEIDWSNHWKEIIKKEI